MDFAIVFKDSPTPEQLAEAQAERVRLKAEREAELRSKPRYRHLFIASDSHMLEILCEELPRWEWVEQ